MARGCKPSGKTFSKNSTGMRELGYIEGRTVETEYIYADGELDRLPALRRRSWTTMSTLSSPRARQGRLPLSGQLQKSRSCLPPALSHQIVWPSSGDTAPLSAPLLAAFAAATRPASFNAPMTAEAFSFEIVCWIARTSMGVSVIVARPRVSRSAAACRALPGRFATSAMLVGIVVHHNRPVSPRGLLSLALV
jgi:hypothetical protein